MFINRHIFVFWSSELSAFNNLRNSFHCPQTGFDLSERQRMSLCMVLDGELQMSVSRRATATSINKSVEAEDN